MKTTDELFDGSFAHLLPNHPETFICDTCGRTKHQDQSTTQRKGWPVCHRMTMKEYVAKDDGEGTGSLDHIHW